MARNKKPKKVCYLKISGDSVSANLDTKNLFNIESDAESELSPIYMFV